MIHRDEQRSRSLAAVPISRRRRQLRTFFFFTATRVARLIVWLENYKSSKSATFGDTVPGRVPSPNFAMSCPAAQKLSSAQIFTHHVDLFVDWQSIECYYLQRQPLRRHLRLAMQSTSQPLHHNSCSFHNSWTCYLQPLPSTLQPSSPAPSQCLHYRHRRNVTSQRWQTTLTSWSPFKPPSFSQRIVG